MYSFKACSTSEDTEHCITARSISSLSQKQETACVCNDLKREQHERMRMTHLQLSGQLLLQVAPQAKEVWVQACLAVSAQAWHGAGIGEASEAKTETETENVECGPVELGQGRFIISLPSVALPACYQLPCLLQGLDALLHIQSHASLSVWKMQLWGKKFAQGFFVA